MVATITQPTATTSVLRRTELRKFLGGPALQEFENASRKLTRRLGGTIFRQGDAAAAIYVVLKGSVELRARPPGRRAYRTVEVVGPGCTFGDEAVFGVEEYLFSARALESSRVISLDRQGFDVLAEARPDIAVGVVRCAGSCLIQTVRRSTILTQAPADVGLERLLAEMAQAERNGFRPGDAVPVRVTHAQLAGLLHLSRETVSRMLSQMAGQGRVELGRGVVRVLPQ